MIERDERRARARRGALVLLVAVTATAGCGRNAARVAARENLEAGRPEAALAVIMREARENPKDTETLLLLARAASAAARDSIAIEALERAGAKGRKDSVATARTRDEIWRSLLFDTRAVIDTLARAGAGDRARAMGLVSRAARYGPNRPATLAARGALLGAKGRVDEAEALFRRATSGTDGDPASAGLVAGALLGAATFFASAGALESAVNAARGAARVAPEDARAWFDLGVHLHRVGEARGEPALFAEAIEAFSRALEILPDDIDARYDLALSAYRLGAWANARAEIEHAIDREPHEARLHGLAARIALAEDDRPRATAHAVAMRALGGTGGPIPASALLVSPEAGRAGAKRFALHGPPEAIWRYAERGGAVVEAWFYAGGRRMVAFSGGVSLAALEPQRREEEG